MKKSYFWNYYSFSSWSLLELGGVNAVEISLKTNADKRKESSLLFLTLNNSINVI